MADRSPLERRRLWLLGGALLVALVLRSIAIDHRFNSDDCYTWYVSVAPTLSGLVDRLVASENTPPLYYLLVRPLPDASEFWLRIPAVLASTASVAVLYAFVRPLLGTKVALLSALGLAVAPFAIASANLARGFSSADLGLLVVVLAASRLALGGPRRRWWAYGAGSVVALYSQYNSPIVLGLVALGLLALGTPPRRETVLFATLPVLLYLPWLPSLKRSLDAVDVTKVAGVPPDSTLRGARDLVLSIVYGRITFEDYGVLPTPRAIAVVAVLVGAAVILWRTEGGRRLTFWCTAGLAAAVFLAHWALALAGAPGVFGPRYISFLVPLGIVVLAAAVAAIPWRALVPLTAAGLLVLAAGIGVLRASNEPNPDMAPVRDAAAALHPRTLLTNTAIVSYYLRDLHPRLDRAFGFGVDGEPRCARVCPRPLVIVDDTASTAGDARKGPGRVRMVDRFVVRLHPPGAR